MSDIYVDYQALPGIATTLEDGASGLEGLSTSAPSGIDAGLMTPVVSAMLAQVIDSAGNVSTSLGAAADSVLTARDYYARADANVNATMAEIEAAMR